MKKYRTNVIPRISMFIALSYTEMNELRARKVNEAKKKGFNIASYVSSNCTTFETFSCGGIVLFLRIIQFNLSLRLVIMSQCGAAII